MKATKVDVNNVEFSLNNNVFTIVDADMDRRLLNSTNYIVENGFKRYSPLELYNDSTNVLAITIKDMVQDSIFKMNNDLSFSLMRNYTPTNMTTC